MTGAHLASLSSTTLGWDHGHMDMGWIPMIIFWVVLVALLIWVFRSKRSVDHGRETPLQILCRRLADGSIGVDEFERRRSLLDPDLAPARPAGAAAVPLSAPPPGAASPSPGAA